MTVDLDEIEAGFDLNTFEIAVSEPVSAAYVAVHGPRLIALARRAEQAEAENARLREAQYWWDADDGENASDDVTTIMDNYDIGEVVRLQCARNLPDEWAVGFVNDAGGFEARTFASETEADAFAAARAALAPAPEPTACHDTPSDPLGRRGGTNVG